MLRIPSHKPKTIEDTSLPLGYISVKSGAFAWNSTELNAIIKPTAAEREIPTILSDINICPKPGSLNVIIGKIGSGKSSLLMAMIDEMVKLQGTITKHGSLAYVPQEAFLLNATVRDNILFGNVYDKKKYQEVLKVCELRPDLAI